MEEVRELSDKLNYDESTIFRLCLYVGNSLQKYSTDRWADCLQEILKSYTNSRNFEDFVDLIATDDLIAFIFWMREHGYYIFVTV
jgi:hypothetical protein